MAARRRRRAGSSARARPIHNAALACYGRGMAKPPSSLPPEDAALWGRVARTVRPLGGARAGGEVSPSRPRTDIRPRAPEAPRTSREARQAPPHAASLDGGWDRRLRQGRVRPERTVDLHGLTQEGAYRRLVGAVQAAFDEGMRLLLVITGRPRGPDEAPRGVISRQFPLWMEGPEIRPYVAAIRRAHQRHGGAGAVYVVLRRHR